MNKNIDENPINFNIEIAAKAELKLDATKTFESLTEPIASVFGTLFQMIIYDKSANYIRRMQIRKIEDEYEINKVKLLKDVELETISEILKIEKQNLLYPKSSLIIPALEALDVYYDEDHYRHMFSKLIVSSMDISKYNDIHPSFSQLIKELSPFDAKLLSILKYQVDKTIIRICRLTSWGDNQTKSSIILIDLTVSEMSEEEITYSINNLSSLGLIDVSLTSLNDVVVDGEIPDYALKSQVYKDMLKASENVNSISGELSFTIRGIKFTRIVLN